MCYRKIVKFHKKTYNMFQNFNWCNKNLVVGKIYELYEW